MDRIRPGDAVVHDGKGGYKKAKDVKPAFIVGFYGIDDLIRIEESHEFQADSTNTNDRTLAFSSRKKT